MSKCFVPFCNSGYKSCKEKVSLFRAPQQKEKLDLWKCAIPRSDRLLSERDVVCGKHFRETDIVRGWKSGDISFKYKKPRLSENAVPSIFPLQPRNIKCKNRGKRRLDIEPPKDIKICATEEGSPPFSRNYIAVATYSGNIFQKILKMEVGINLPDDAWLLLVDDKESVIYIKELNFVNANCQLFSRQIIIGENCSLKFFVGTKEISFIHDLVNTKNALASTTNLEYVVRSFHNLNICTGGPTVDELPPSFVVKNVAYVDITGRWRHKNCVLVFKENSNCCRLCFKLVKKCCEFEINCEVKEEEDICIKDEPLG